MQIRRTARHNSRIGLSILIVALVTCWSVPAQADEIAIGLLSFDNIIPPGTGPGVNAFNLYNLTGPDALFDPSAVDPLTFFNAVLTLNPDGGAATTIDLGDVLPGQLTDSSGMNPLVQVPSDANFVSATFTANLTTDLSPLSLHLSDGSTFAAASSISVSLSPLSGPDLVADTDFAVIDAEPAAVSPVPEPATETLLAAGMIVFFCLPRMKSSRENTLRSSFSSRE
jgi:hypothetical protein